MERQALSFIGEGLMTCKVKFINPFKDEEVECEALIDTGAELTVICQTIFEQFTVEEANLQKHGISTVNADEEDVHLYPFHISIPSGSWYKINSILTVVRDLTKREEYKAIVGIDFLRNCRLHCDWIRREAYLDI